MIPAGIQKYFPSAPRLADSPRTALVKYSLVLLLIITGVFNLRSAFLFQVALNTNNGISHSRSLANPDALADIARNVHIKNKDLASALSLYKRAVENFVLHLPSWIGMAKVSNSLGKTSEGKKALSFIHANFPNSEALTWSKVELASSVGHEKILTENLLWLAQHSPSKRKEVFSLANYTWKEPNILMKKFGPVYYSDILQEYLNNDAFKESLTVWNTIVTSKTIQQDAAFRYVDYLVDQKATLLAARVWKETVGEDSPLLYNGDFEQLITHSGFGWRIPDHKGYSWGKGEYGIGLSISFNGRENVAFQLAQTLPISPGRYVLSGTVETDGLTTDQLPFWLIQGVQCSGLNTQSEMVLPYQHPSEFIHQFSVPDSCELIRVSLTRRPSSHYDNRINGVITVSNLSIQPAEKTHQRPKETTINTNKLLIQ